MRVSSYTVLRSILVFDTVILVVVAVLLWQFMEHPAGTIGGSLCCLAAGMSYGGARWLDGRYERRR